jgi:hypothetical protein
MSNSCPPDYTLSCDVASLPIKSRHLIPNFCNDARPAYQSYRAEACDKLGLPGEWGNNELAGQCTFRAGTINDICEYGGGIIGTKVSCERLNFLGDTSWCCLNPGHCFVNDDQSQGTCPPNCRATSGPEGSGCQPFYIDYCTTSAKNKIVSLWQPGGFCRRVLTDNGDDLEFVSAMGSGLLQNAFGAGPIPELGEPGTDDALVETVYDVCWDNPAACNRYLKSTTCPQYTRQQLAGLKTGTKFCGCSLCVSSQNIKDVDINGSEIHCRQTLCVIDNVFIEAEQIGNVTFEQACGSCQNGACACIIKDVEISAGGTIGNIDLSQKCFNTKCYETSPSGQVVEIKCDNEPTPGTPPPGSEPKEDSFFKKVTTKIPIWAIILMAVLGILIFLMIIFVLFMLFKKKK